MGVIRQATEQDLPMFSQLWLELIKEELQLGGEFRPTLHTLDFFVRAFSAYISKALDGVVLLAEPDHGILMWGEPGPHYPDTWRGKIAIGHGTYVRPELRRQGISKDLWARARQLLLEMEFDFVLGTAALMNKPSLRMMEGAGFMETGRSFALKLRGGD